jgi:prephenate dehydratase
MKIAYQGEPGAYSEAAALRFSPNATTVPCESFDDVFAAVEGGKTTHGILPIENSIGGSIHRNYDLLLEHELPVVAEVLLQVSHNLLALPGTKLADIKKVYSHPQGLAQCEGFLSSLKGVEIVATYDTAGSAKMKCSTWNRSPQASRITKKTSRASSSSARRRPIPRPPTRR